jgi:hypothetical protein
LLGERRISLCPSRFCSAPNPVQSLVSKPRAEKLKEPALDGCVICGSCGCVYTRDLAGRPKVLGRVIDPGSPWEAWKTAYPPPQNTGTD